MQSIGRGVAGGCWRGVVGRRARKRVSTSAGVATPPTVLFKKVTCALTPRRDVSNRFPNSVVGLVLGKDSAPKKGSKSVLHGKVLYISDIQSDGDTATSTSSPPRVHRVRSKRSM